MPRPRVSRTDTFSYDALHLELAPSAAAAQAALGRDPDALFDDVEVDAEYESADPTVGLNGGWVITAVRVAGTAVDLTDDCFDSLALRVNEDHPDNPSHDYEDESDER